MKTDHILAVIYRADENGFSYETFYKSGKTKTHRISVFEIEHSVHAIPNAVRKFVDTAPHKIKLYGKLNYCYYHEADAFRQLLGIL